MQARPEEWRQETYPGIRVGVQRCKYPTRVGQGSPGKGTRVPGVPVNVHTAHNDFGIFARC
eukprot:2129743-Rhodomonas_salina.1